VLGDFNSVRFDFERRGIRRDLSFKTEIDKFNDFILRCKLFDLPAVGRKYMWYRPNELAKSIMDKIFVLEVWLQQWPDSKQFIMSRSMSNHCALVVKNSTFDWGPKPFRTFDV